MVVNIILALIIYFPAFSAFFFMDDFYFLALSRADSFRQFIDFFKPIKFVPYRPISQQIFFFSLQKIFGLNPLPFHIFIFLVHFANSWLIYKISRKFIKNSSRAKIFSLIYAVSSLHFIGLYSITGSYIIFGVFFFLLSFWLWLKFEQKKQNLAYLLSFLFFILGIFSSEIIASLPFIILIISKFKKKLKFLSPYLLLIFINFLINLNFAGAPKTQAFQIHLSSFPSLFRWYLLRAFGLPEGVKNGALPEKIIIYLLFSLLLIIFSFGFFLKKNQIKKNSRIIIKYFLWIIIASLPFYFMPNHLNPIYFSISFIGFLFILNKILTKKLFFAYGLIFVILSFFGVRLLLHTHWTVNRSILAKEWTKKIADKCDVFKKQNKAIVVVKNKPIKDELEIILQKDIAVQLICKNKKLKTVYKIKNTND